MPQRSYNPVAQPQSSSQTKKRSALGIGITTLVTVIVILLLVAFAVLSLATSRFDLRLSQMASEQTQRYYTADGEATLWYAELDAFVAGLANDGAAYSEQLMQAGYEVSSTDEGELRVTKSFANSEHRNLVVAVAVNDDKTTTIRQWQS